MLVLSFLSFLSPNSLLGRDGNKSSVEAAVLRTKEQNVILACLFSLASLPWLVSLEDKHLTGFALATPQLKIHKVYL